MTADSRQGGGSRLTIPEDAWSKAWDAAAEVRDAAPRVHNDADTGDVVEAALAAAAPLIVAAAFEQYAETINYPRFRTSTTSGLVTSVDLVREDLLRLAAELRDGAQ